LLLRTALFFTRSYARLLRPGYAAAVAAAEPAPRRVASAFTRLSEAIDNCCAAVRLTAA